MTGCAHCSLVLRIVKTPYLTWILFVLLSASMLCFEVVATRVASVVFVSDFAYIIISLGILGLGGGGWIAHQRGVGKTTSALFLPVMFSLLGFSLALFAAVVTWLAITSAYLFFPLLVVPFVIGGILSARLYSTAAGSGYGFYASDLAGAVIGSLTSLGIINMLGAGNSILFLALLTLCGAAVSLGATGKARQAYLVMLLLACAAGGLLLNGKHELLGEVAIGRYPAKDFYFVYPDPSIRPRIVDSRWSIFGRADLVAYSHQDVVMQLFVDGAAGSQVYRFNGDVQHTNSNLQGLLLQHSNAMPFLCLREEEKRSMLVIGPGGGKEILLGLFGGAGQITGVEVNPDIVAIVRDHRSFDGGIYTDFPNVRIVVDEGRHYVRQMEESIDLLVMALPSTAQMQNIEPYATNENFLLTQEALQDYFRVLKPGGLMVLTVHNPWELARMLVTAVSVLHDRGTPAAEIPDHFVLFESEYAPTVVIKKAAFSVEEARHWQEVCSSLPPGFPPVTYLPHGGLATGRSLLSPLVAQLSQSAAAVRAAVNAHHLNISPCSDDSPYFYNRSRWGPSEPYWLLGSVLVWCTLVVWIPLRRMRRGGLKFQGKTDFLPLVIAICAGTGFMILEISLLQKLLLWLGEPTTSLAVLLAVLLAGMGVGSLAGGVLAPRVGPARLLMSAVGSVIVLGILHAVFSSEILALFLKSGFAWRLMMAGIVLLPLSVALGIPFPVAMQVLREGGRRELVPWIYGVNCSFSVLGSVLAIVFSIIFGFRAAFGMGLLCYLVIGWAVWKLMLAKGLEKVNA
jgi:spermidine synthase/MFS family permease